MVLEMVLERFAYMYNGAFGILTVYINGEKKFKCTTAERPWRNNVRMESCIPKGRYPLKRAVHKISTPDPNDDYDCWEIADVPDRTAIHIHVANTPEDVFGCVAVGVKHGCLDQSWATLSSRSAFKALEFVTKDFDEGFITIINYTKGGEL
jgi:hypothetical protein